MKLDVNYLHETLFNGTHFCQMGENMPLAAILFFCISLRLHLYCSHNPIPKPNHNKGAILSRCRLVNSSPSWRDLTTFLKQGRMLEATLIPLAVQRFSKIKRNWLAPHQSSWFNHVQPCFLAEVSCILIQDLGSHLSACSCASNHIQVNAVPRDTKCCRIKGPAKILVLVTLSPSQETKPGCKPDIKTLTSSKFWQRCWYVGSRIFLYFSFFPSGTWDHTGLCLKLAHGSGIRERFNEGVMYFQPSFGCCLQCHQGYGCKDSGFNYQLLRASSASCS